MNKRALLFVAAVVAVAIGAWFALKQPSTDASAPVQTQVVQLGAVLPLTGDVAAYGTGSKEGIDFAVERANKAQNRYRFVVTYEDSKGDPKTAVTGLQKLLAIDKPIAIIGENVSSPTLAMVPIVDAAKVVLISPSASAPNLSGMSRYFFRVFPSDSEEGVFMCDAIKKNDPNARVCVLYINNDYGVGLKQVVQARAQQAGLKVLGVFGYDKTMTDYRPILAKVKALAPSSIYLPGYYQDGAAILKQARELGIKANFWGATTHDDPQFVTLAGQAAEGFRYPVSAPYDPLSQDSTVRTFVTGFKTVRSAEPGLLAALGYDCAQLLIGAVIANGPSSDAIQKFIGSQQNYPGVTGTMTFDDKGDVHKPIHLKQIQEGSASAID